MTKDFERKVLNNYPVDTKRYRYTIKNCDHYDEVKGFVCATAIIRLPLKDLDTTAAITDWETVKMIEE